jgi:hypothetical protein
MICPCKSRIDCAGDDNPFTGFNTDAADCCTEIGVQYRVGGQLPALGSNWVNSNCVAFADACDQDTADSMALSGYYHCVALNNRTPPAFDFVDPPDVPTPWDVDVFGNTPQTCSALCPDGLLFSFTVRENQFFALSQIEADNMAHSFACRQLAINQVCMGSLIPTECCLNQTYSAFISATGTFSPFVFTVVSGSIPTGMLLTTVSASAVKLAGNPSMAGTFRFSLKATDSHGNFMVKAYALNVISISNGAIPTATVGTPYSFTFSLAGTLAAPATWSLVSGSLPAGLSMNSSGVISGTPTTAGASAFTVQVGDGSITCQKAFTVNTQSSGPPPVVCPVLVGTIAGVSSGTEYSLTPSKSAATQRIAIADITVFGSEKVRFINTATDTVAATINFNTSGVIGCFATSQSHFFLRDGSTANNISVFDQNGGFVATVAYPNAPSNPVYSAVQDRVYVTTLPGFTHVRGVNPTTNAIVSDDNLGANYAAGSQLFNLNERLMFSGFLFFQALFFFDIPGMTLAGNVPIPGGFAGGACYAANAGKYLISAFNSGTFNLEVWQIDPTTFAIEHIYLPTDTGDNVFSLEYNPVTGAVIGKQQNNPSPMIIIDPVAKTIVCEFNAGGDINAVVDAASGKIYTGDDGVPQTRIYQ